MSERVIFFQALDTVQPMAFPRYKETDSQVMFDMITQKEEFSVHGWHHVWEKMKYQNPAEVGAEVYNAMALPHYNPIQGAGLLAIYLQDAYTTRKFLTTFRYPPEDIAQTHLLQTMDYLTRVDLRSVDAQALPYITEWSYQFLPTEIYSQEMQARSLRLLSKFYGAYTDSIPREIILQMNKKNMGIVMAYFDANPSAANSIRMRSWRSPTEVQEHLQDQNAQCRFALAVDRFIQKIPECMESITTFREAQQGLTFLLQLLSDLPKTAFFADKVSSWLIRSRFQLLQLHEQSQFDDSYGRSSWVDELVDLRDWRQWFHETFTIFAKAYPWKPTEDQIEELNQMEALAYRSTNEKVMAWYKQNGYKDCEALFRMLLQAHLKAMLSEPEVLARVTSGFSSPDTSGTEDEEIKRVLQLLDTLKRQYGRRG